MQTLQDLLPEIARLGNREAIRWSNGFRTFVSSYADLYGMIGAVVADFDERGIRKGDRILVWAENRMEWVAVFWACVASGVVAVPVDFRFSNDLVRRIQSEAKPRLTIDRAVLDRIADLPGVSKFQPAAVTLDDVVEIVYTSGTTGDPKGVTHRHRHICANLRPFEEEINKYKKWAGPFQPIRVLDLLPLSHMFGQALGIYIPVLLGGAAAFTPEMHPGKIVELAREHRITVIVAVPQILENLKNQVERQFRLRPPAQSIALRLWRYRRIHSAFGWKFWAFVAGGAPVDPELEEWWSRLGFLVIQGYGLTEASPVVAVNHPFDVKRGSLGKPLPGLQVTIASDGEILVRGESITTENGGWLHTGDLGETDSEGRLYYRGRKNDMIVTPEGLNVHPEDVEHVLDQFPEIRESAVVSVRRNGNEQVHAVLILNDPNADVEAVVRRANEKLEAHQRVRSWSVWPGNDFPRTASTMKVRRGEVGRQVASGYAKELEIKPAGKDLRAMSSLERVELLSELESKYQVELNEEEFSKLENSQELEEWLRRSVAVPQRRAAVRRGVPSSDWARSLPVRALRTAFQQLLAIPLFKHYLPLTVTGLEHLRDLEPPVLFAANHTSHLDAPAIFVALPFQWRRRLAPAMGLDVFRPYFEPDRFSKKEVWWTGLGYALALGLFNAYPLPQEMAGVRRALNYTGELVKRGYCPLVFPEGSRSADGKLQPFRPGIGMMAIRLRVPVVPIYIEGLYNVYSIQDSWPKRGPVRVSFGHPKQFAVESYDEVAQKIRDAIEDLR
jgi:long-chain acyl-CoA synthetase